MRIFSQTAARHTSSSVLYFQLPCDPLHVEPTVRLRAARGHMTWRRRLRDAVVWDGPKYQRRQTLTDP
jgi:hypothetical protein